MRKITFLSLLFVALGVSAQTTVTYTFAEKGFSNQQVIENGVIDANLSYVTAKNGANQAPTYYTPGELRVYSVRSSGDGNSITINTSNGATITGLEIYANTSYTPKVKYSVDGGELQEATLAATTYSITGINATRSLKIVNAHTGGQQNTQLRTTGFKVTYTINTAAPSIVVNPVELDFDKINVGATSAGKTITVTGTNLSEAPTYSVNSSEFTVAGTLTAAGGELTVTFSPVSGGEKAAVLTITGSGETKTIALSGNGFDASNPYNLDDSAPVNTLRESFGDGSVTVATLPAGWVNVSVLGVDRKWEVKRYNNNNYAQMTAYNGTGQYQTLLISPAINFDAIDKTAVKFNWNSGYTKPGTTLKVFVLSKDGTKVEVKSIDDNSNPSGYGAAFNTETLDLSAHAGVKFLAFEYSGTAGSTTSTYRVDDVEISPLSSLFATKFDTLSVWVSNGKVHFTAAAGEKVEVFNVMGQKTLSVLALDGQNEITVPFKGVAVVKVGNRVGKVVL